MDEYSITARTERLRQEIELIQDDERCYRRRGYQTPDGKLEHDKRQNRLVAIREELRSLFNKSKQQSGHGSVWYDRTRVLRIDGQR